MRGANEFLCTGLCFYVVRRSSVSRGSRSQTAAVLLRGYARLQGFCEAFITAVSRTPVTQLHLLLPET